MNLYPAIDLLGGKVVRLQKGDYDQVTVYADNPADFVKTWCESGVRWIHVVDLDGAKDGGFTNAESLKTVINHTSAKVEFGGGVRTQEHIDQLIDLGVSRVILGTKALDEDFLKTAISKHGDKIAVGMDVSNGKIKTAGWIDDSGMDIEKGVEIFNACGVSALIFTDISRDGMLMGPNFTAFEEVLNKSTSKVILSGGISSLEDLEECRKIKAANFEGVIVGKALYENKFNISQAVEVIQK